MGSLWETAPLIGEQPQQRQKKQVQVKGIIQTQNLRAIQWKHFTTSNMMKHLACKYIVQIECAGGS